MRLFRNHVGNLLPRWLLGAAIILLGGIVLTPASAFAWADLTDDGGFWDPSGVLIVDGSYVMNAGELQVNITNFGLIGSWPETNNTFSDAPSAQWPAGSGVEYLFSGGLWVGGVLIGERLVSTGQYEMEFRPLDEIEDTIYEAKNGRIIRPAGNELAGGKRAPESGDDDDDDGVVDEEILNGYDDDEDGLIDEDFAQIGNQMMVTTTYDNTKIASEIYADHTPLNLKVVQSSYSWENDDADDFVAFEFEITNIGVADIDEVYIGFFADSDIGARSQPGRAEDDMAGSFDGMVLARDNTYVPVSFGYMYDDDGDNGMAEGYFGIVFLGHDVDPTGNLAPTSIGLRSYQSFSGQQSFDQGGDPVNDSQRYELLSLDSRDPNVVEGKENDYRFLVSAGPFKVLPPGETLKFQAAMVVGRGLSGLKANCAEAVQTWYGNQFNTDGDPNTGINGRETQICLGDYSGTPNPIFTFVADLMDTSCVSLQYLLSQPQIKQSDLKFDPDRNDQCIYVNLDNCFECARQNGQECTKDNRLIETNWNCWDPEVSDTAKGGCTGVGGNENTIHWLVGMAPPAPGMRVWPTDNSVHVYWDNSSEVTKDVRLDLIDFESYRIWRADNWDRPFGSSFDNGPESGLWQLVAEYDLVNYFIQSRELSNGSTVTDTLPLGANTSLDDIVYDPVCLDDPEYDGLYEAMEEIILADSLGVYFKRPQFVDGNNNILPEFQVLEPWKNIESAVLDTFFYVIPRPEYGPGTVAKDAVKYYEYIDQSVHNGFIYFYSVTASDHAMQRKDGEISIIGAGSAGDPGSSFTHTSPGTPAQTPDERSSQGTNIYAYPNPATREALAEFQELNPNADDPTGVRINFANLPRARNTIKIFSLNGDLIQTIDHDGRSDYGEASWNLISRNGQEVVSGIYLYVVQSDDGAFDDFIGKFVVIR